MITTLKMQYDYLKQSRKIVFDYCSTISSEHFVEEKEIFGQGSIRNILVHVTNCYVHWIGVRTLKLPKENTPEASINTIPEMRAVYKEVDGLMNLFFEFVEASPTGQIVMEVNGSEKRIDALQLFTHMLTHEFHHKGQILTLGRALGYKPVDTDIL